MIIILLFTGHLEIRHKQGKHPYKFDTYKHGRHPDYRHWYSYFLNTFVQPVVGLSLWKRRILAPNADEHPNNLCTISDEAFAMVYLDNIYNRCLDIFEKNDKKVPEAEKKGDDGKRKKPVLSDIEPKYTSGGTVYGNSTPSSATKGWSKEGLEAYNDFYEKIKKHREDYPDFHKWFISEEVRKLEAQDVPRLPRKRKSSFVSCKHDFYEDTPMNVSASSSSRLSSGGSSIRRNLDNTPSSHGHNGPSFRSRNDDNDDDLSSRANNITGV